jgi:hypothetical protein
MFAQVTRRLQDFRQLWAGGALRDRRVAGMFIAFFSR